MAAAMVVGHSAVIKSDAYLEWVKSVYFKTINEGLCGSILMANDHPPPKKKKREKKT